MHCISISHKTAPLHIRQLFAFNTEEKLAFEKNILSRRVVEGCVVVSTCNRSEIYFSGEYTAISVVEKEAAGFKNIDLSEFKRYILHYSDENALKHLFKVVCGLDSMVLGEDEIQRQLKDAYQLSLNNASTTNELNIAFQCAFNNAKSVKTDTKLSNTPVSIGTLAANRISDFLKSREKPNALVVGASGKVGRIVIKNLCEKLQLSIFATSRSHHKSWEMYEDYKNITFIEYSERYKYIDLADVVVSATTSPHYIFTCQEAAREITDNKEKKLFVDLAVPNDIDKDILTLANIELIDIDYFKKASEENNLSKLKELDKVELILERNLDETLKNLDFHEFYCDFDKIMNKVSSKGFLNIMRRFKKNLNSKELRSVLTVLRTLAKEE